LVRRRRDIQRHARAGAQGLGYSRDDIEKLWGGNLLRVWREVEEVAAESR